MELPAREDLERLTARLSEGDEPWVRVIDFDVEDGDSITITWDEVADSFHVRWKKPAGVRLQMTREGISKVSVHQTGAEVVFLVWSKFGEAGGRLMVEIGSSIAIEDSLLRG